MVRPASFLIVMLAACDGGSTAESTAPTWHGDIRKVVATRCLDCHQAGGVGPIDMSNPDDWADGAPAWAAMATAAVESGRMPPWLPADDCHPIESNGGLTDDEREAFAAWAAAEFPVGDADDFIPPEMPDRPMLSRKLAWGAPDKQLVSAEPYRPDPAQPDDYRCIVIDEAFDQAAWIRGMEVRPDAKEYVHHLIVYRFDASQVEREVTRPDAEDPGPGFACFNNPNAETVMGWAPGQNGEFLPEGVARYVPAGSRLVLQIHYNTLGKDPASIPEDQTAVDVWFQPAPEPVEQAVWTIPFPDMGIELPAGDPNVVEKEVFSVRNVFGDIPITVPVIGVMAHMHQLGTAISLDVKQGRDRKACVLDIPRWDFNWQQTYYFPEDDWIQVGSNTEFHMTCKYDNSAANQIVVNGEQLEPRDVRWGEGTTDEMCLTYLMTLVPASFVAP